MNPMTVFEVVYWLALVVEVVIRTPINKQRKKGTMSEQRVSTQERVMLGVLWFGMMIFPLAYSATRWLDFANYTVPAWASWIGVVLIIGALVVFWRAHADLGLNWSPSLEIRSDHTLVTRGIYGVIRHPMYASQFLWVLAQPLLLPNWIAGFLAVVIFIPFYILRVSAEEKMMQDTFGPQYTDYMRRTGRIFPKIG